MENDKLIESLIENTDSAFGLHKIVLDKKGNPIDYVFEKINKNFERYTGLKEENIIGKKVTEVLPEVSKSNFNWIVTYGKVALTGKSLKFEAFSEILNKHYSVFVFSPEKYYFVTLFNDISEKKSKELLNKLQHQNFELSTINKVITDLSKMQSKYEVYHYLINFIHELMPDSIILSLEKIDDEQLKLLEVKGLEKNIIKKIIDLAGFDFYTKQYKIVQEYHDIFAKNSLYEHKDGLEKFASSVIPASISKAIQKLLGIKSIYTIGLVTDNNHIGDFHFFLRGNDIINQLLIENLFYQSAIVLERIAENDKNKELLQNFQTFYNSLQDFVFVVDKQGNIKYANEYAKIHLEYSFEEFKELHIKSLCNKQNVNELLENLELTKINSEINNRFNECTYYSKSGKGIPVEMIIYSGFWDGEEIFYFIGKDLTKIHTVENKFRLAFKNNPSPMAITELRTGKFIDVNDAFLKVLKYKREDVIGKGSLELNIFENPSIRKDIIEKILKEKLIINYKFNFRTFDSEIRNSLMSSEIIVIDNIEYLLSTFVDITDRIQLENRIKEINKNLLEENKLFQNGPVVLFKLKYESNYPILFVSENVNELSGYNAEEMKENKISFIDLVHYLDRNKIIEEIESSCNTTSLNYINHSDFRLNTKDERLTWVNLFTLIVREDNGKVKELLGYAYDITSTKKSEENLQAILKNLEWKNRELEEIAHKLELQINERTLIEKMLRESEEKFRSLSESAKDGIIILDSKGEVTYWNKAAEEIFGYKNNEMIGKEFHKVITTKKMNEEHKSKMRSFMESGTGALIGKIIEVQAIHKNGNTIDVELSLSAVQIQNEWNAIGIVRDITERKKAEQKLADLNDELNLANIEKDKFFSIIAHDLKGPLGGLIGLSELIAEDIDTIEKDELVEIAQNFHSSLQNIYKLLENLLEWSRLQRNTIQFNPEIINLKLLSNNTFQLLKAALSNKKITLINNISDDAFAFADENIVSTILRNLINNSLKFINTEGTITISSQNIEGEKVIVSVQDTGIGMDEEHQKNLFKIGNNYSRLGTDNEQGTGLGLILCKEFVNKNGGEIWVESQEGVGTTFFFSLPTRKN